VAVAFQPLDEAVHAFQELGHLGFQGPEAGFTPLHLLAGAGLIPPRLDGKANLGLFQPADQVSDSRKLLTILGKLLAVPVHRRLPSRLLLEDELHGPFDIHSLYCSKNAPTGSTRFHFHAGCQEKIHHGRHGEHRGSLKLLLESRELLL